MTTFHFQTHVSDSGMLALPPLPPDFYGEEVEIILHSTKNKNRESQPDPARILPNGKTVIDDFLDYYRDQPPTSLTDEEIEKTPMTQKRKASPEEAQKFMDICYGCLEGLCDEKFEQMKMERILEK